MAETRYYTVTQEREVKVAADSAINAAQLATVVFEGGPPVDPESQAYTTTNVRIRDIVAREDY